MAANEQPTLHQVVVAELGRVDRNRLSSDCHDATATQLLTAIAERVRGEIGPADCGCGGCDACAQHALADWLDPR